MSYYESVAIVLAINILLGISLYLPMAAGQISLGHGGFMAIGAYVCAYLASKAGVAFPLALLAGGLAAALSGLMVGFPALRIRGIYLIILTMGFGEIVRIFFLNFEPTGGPSGMTGIKPLTTLAGLVVSCALAILLAVQLRRSRVGRAMIAVHEDEGAAEAMGIHLVYIKLMSFAVGAFIAGIAGGFYAHYALFIEPAQFGFVRSAEAFLFVVLGGFSTVLGPIVGAAFVTLLPEFLRFIQEWRMTFFGALLVIAALWRPDGLIAPRRLKGG
ncbi:MAG: branched-chain amino acid ABC transporter permease [Betaproteobacteria bacterium]|nr:branched-chain amino acid ABC transporter permease [Betaproteobacteria bacterium]